MEQEKTLLDQAAFEGYDAADLPFDRDGERGATALVCEPDPAFREKIIGGLKERGYRITMPATAADALQALRFHLFDVVVLNERFDAPDPQTNAVLQYLEQMGMTTRRRIFVALVSATYGTMDNMAAYSRSVNVTINRKNIHDAGEIIKRGVAENRAFYHIFRETLRKLGKA